MTDKTPKTATQPTTWFRKMVTGGSPIALRLGIFNALLLAAYAQGAATPAAHSILSGTSVWQALGPVRDAERPAATLYVGGPETPKAIAISQTDQFAAVTTSDGFEFRLHGEAGEKRSMRWRCVLASPQPIPADGETVYLIRYQASGIQREVAAYPIVQLNGQAAPGKAGSVALLDCHTVINDGRPHTLVGRLVPGFTAEEVLINLSTENTQTAFQMLALEVYPSVEALPLPASADLAGAQEKTRQGFLPVALEGDRTAAPPLNDSVAAAFDRVFAAHGKVVDGLRRSPAGQVTVSGVSFVVAGGSSNMIHTVQQADPNNETVTFLGAKVTRKNFFRPSRDDLISVPLGGRRAAEVLFLLVCEMPPVQTRYGLSPAPYRLDDVEAFAVELVYVDGSRDWAFPYSLADGGCVLARMAGAYAVAADDSRGLERIVFHNRLFGVNVSVAAVTLNTATRLVPALVDETPPVQPTRLARPAHRRPYLVHRDGLLTGGNSYYAFTVDCRHGFSLRNLSSQWSPGTPWSLDPSSGLEVVLARQARATEEVDRLAGTAAVAKEVDVGKKVFTGRAFSVEQVKVEGDTAAISLHSLHAELPLKITVHLKVDDSPRLATSIETTNLGKEPFAGTIRFPVLKDLAIGAPADDWIFFPQYRALISRDPVFVTALNGPYFSHQFFDAYNPIAGVGLATVTHNVKQWPIEYSMRKSAAGISCSVAYPGRFLEIAPGQTLKPPRTSLVWHDGDWHQAAREYQEWLRAWYRPRRVYADWWRNAFVMRSYPISSTDSANIDHTPSILDRASRQYRIDEAYESDRRYWEQPPDLAHFYGWYVRDEARNNAWGEYSTPQAYDAAGGLDALRQAIRHFQDDLHMPLSLYTIGDRCNEGTSACERFGEKGMRWRAGAVIPPIKTPMGQFRVMCLGYKPWQDHYVADLAKLHRDTGAKIIYLDVFPLQTGNACDCSEHGHEKPLWFDRTSHQILTRIRDALSQDVAIYSEYPMSDVTSQEADGNVAYYNLPLHRHFDKLHDVQSPDERAATEAETPFSLYRYVFPAIKQFCFGVGVEHSRSDSCLKIPFFNGDAEYGVTWRLNPERVRQITNRGLALQKKYLDCFMSEAPEPQVPTLRRGVYANRFPGRGRSLWTLWNARYQTVRGVLLAVAHQPGARYFDTWNEKELKPVIRDGHAILSLELGPQSVGCISQTLPTP